MKERAKAMPSFPIHSETGEYLRDMKQPGYYPGFSTLAQAGVWDDATKNVVAGRVKNVPEIHFFSSVQAELLSAIAARLIPQDDRAEDRRIALVPSIDERLAKNELNGFRYEDTPPDREAYRLGLQAIDEMAQQRFNEPFIELTVKHQEVILKSLHDGAPDPSHPVWKRMPVRRFWALLLGDCITAYYSHPWAWDEIGFGGPAYPRGYMRLENGLPEPWEVDERRYEWKAPSSSFSELDLSSSPPDYSSGHGHGGTH